MVKIRLVVGSLLIAALIFFTGVLAGWGVERYASSTIFNELRESELYVESYIVEQEVIDVFGGDKCELLQSRVGNVRWMVQKLGRQLTLYEEKLIISPEEYRSLLRRYFIFEIRFLTTIQQLNEECEANYTTILFFYKTGNIDSKKQGMILDVYSAENNFEPVVISLNIGFDEPLIKLLADMYGIKENDAPALVINNRVVKKGLTSKEEIYEAVSSR